MLRGFAREHAVLLVCSLLVEADPAISRGRPMSASLNSHAEDILTRAQSLPEGLLTVEVDRAEGVTTLILGGELDASGEQFLENAFAMAESDPDASIVIDLSRLQFMDSTGLNCFIVAHKRAKQQSRMLQVVNASGLVRRIFAITGLEFLLDCEAAAVPGAARARSA